MIIYRIETERGDGPYAASSIGYKCGSKHSAPGPNEDSGLRPGWSSLGMTQDAYYFGFASPTQLLEWFASEEFHQEAEKRGYLVSEIEVSGNVLHGTHQSVFERSKSQVRKRLTFAEIKQLASITTH